MQLTDLTHTLSTYSENANKAVTAVSSGLRPMAFIILGIFLLLELNNWKAILNPRGQTMTRKLWIEITVKYLFAVILILASNLILDAVLELGNILVKVGAKVTTLESVLYHFDSGEISGWIERLILNLIGGVVQFVANVIVILLVFMRFVELYILKAIAPVLIAFFMSEAMRSVAINFFKLYGAYVLVTFGMLIVTIVFNFLAQEDFLNALGRATAGEWGVAFASIGKGVVYILIMVGITRKAKQWLGVS